MKHFLNVTVLRVKVYKDLDGIGIYHEESKWTWREKGRVYGRGIFTRICFGAWVQFLFYFLVVDAVNFSPPDDKVYKGEDVRYFIVFVPRNNGWYTKAPVDGWCMDNRNTRGNRGFHRRGVGCKKCCFMVLWGSPTFPIIEEEYPPVVLKMTSCSIQSCTKFSDQASSPPSSNQKM